MLVVAGINLGHLEPRVWAPSSQYYLSELRAVMFSYAEIHRNRSLRQRLMSFGFRSEFGIPDSIKIFVDNGSFAFSKRGVDVPVREYEAFVEATQPDWKPVPQDFIPAPSMSLPKQKKCLEKTMAVNFEYRHNGFVPVIHISKVLNRYVEHIKAVKELDQKPALAIGGIVPNLLRTPKAMAHKTLVKNLTSLRKEFASRSLHVFGVGGISTLHLASILGFDSIDSSGWRNRAARGIIMLPGMSERSVADLGSWLGRSLTKGERISLEACSCPSCLQHGFDGLTLKGSTGFRNRATHNLWVLLEENRWIETHLRTGTYFENYSSRIENSLYKKLIFAIVSETKSIKN